MRKSRTDELYLHVSKPIKSASVRGPVAVEARMSAMLARSVARLTHWMAKAELGGFV